jgi:hypothetical protein
LASKRKTVGNREQATGLDRNKTSLPVQGKGSRRTLEEGTKNESQEDCQKTKEAIGHQTWLSRKQKKKLADDKAEKGSQKGMFGRRSQEGILEAKRRMKMKPISVNKSDKSHTKIRKRRGKPSRRYPRKKRKRNRVKY